MIFVILIIHLCHLTEVLTDFFLYWQQGNTHLKQTKMIFFFQKKDRTSPVCEFGTSGRGRMWRDGEYGENIVYTCM
jgi:hypothetical protein